MWIKVCGVTDVENAREVADAGVDAVGLNFYEQSRRCVDLTTATQIVSALPESVTPVGLFVNHSVRQIRETLAATGIRTIQLHGEETIEHFQELAEYDIVRAIRPSDAPGHSAAELIHPLSDANVRLKAVLIDAHVEGQYGGTGATATWDSLTPQQREANWPPVILAGGLTPENVSAAIRLVQPWGVDVAGGVEGSPGVKDVDLVRRFVEQARAAS